MNLLMFILQTILRWGRMIVYGWPTLKKAVKSCFDTNKTHLLTQTAHSTPDPTVPPWGQIVMGVSGAGK